MGITKETQGSLLLKGVLGLEINEVIRGITTSSLYSMKIKKARKIANLSLGHLLRGCLDTCIDFCYNAMVSQFFLFRLQPNGRRRRS